MSQIIVFIQAHGSPEIKEAELSATATFEQVSAALIAAGIALDAETLVFIDEGESPLAGDPSAAVLGLKHGSRVHVHRCRQIHVTVHFNTTTLERKFAPGAKVRRVKEWAVHELKMDPKDAADHVLQICGSKDRPSTDTPLAQLAQAPGCTVCFDLVPEKRVEG